MSDKKWVPHVVVATVVERDGKFLLVEERVSGSSQLVLNQPAGHWEQGETFVEAAVRETQEETGWRVQPTHVLGIYEHEPENLGYPFVRICFIADALVHSPEQKLDTGIERALWLSAEEIAAQASRHRSPMVTLAVKDYINNKRYPLDLINNFGIHSE